jgi:YVTN family beta-propeller protein
MPEMSRDPRRLAARRRLALHRTLAIGLGALGAAGLAAAIDGFGSRPAGSDSETPPTQATLSQAPPYTPPPSSGPLGRLNVYAYDTANALSPLVRRDPPLVYVPNSQSDTVDVIDQRSKRVIRHFSTGALPQHVTPSWDLRTLYVDNDAGNTLTPIDPASGKPRGRQIPVEDPYNLYFAPDGRSAIVVAERLQRLDFRTPGTMRMQKSLAVPCRGVDHMDFSADGRVAYASCEFEGAMIRVDLRSRRMTRKLVLGHGGGSPQDVKLSPDGHVLYVADQVADGVWELDAHRFRTIGFLPTGAGTHGLYPSRDGRVMYISNRQEGSVSIMSFARRRLLRKIKIPGSASPDMGGVSADGRTLWLSGRYNDEVYAIDVRSGRLEARVKVGAGPHGLAVWPQPGRHSLGHTGNMR